MPIAADGHLAVIACEPQSGSELVLEACSTDWAAERLTRLVALTRGDEIVR